MIRLATPLIVLSLALPCSAPAVPWADGADVDVSEVAALVVEGAPGGRAGYAVAVAYWDSDEYLDLVVAEPGADLEADPSGEAEGRIGIFLGPLRANELGSSPGAPASRTFDEADLVLTGPPSGRLGSVLLAHPIGPDGPALAAAVPGALGLDPIPEGWVEAAYHFGEVWILDGGVDGCPSIGVAQAGLCATNQLWWEGEATRNPETDAFSLEGPHEFAYELATMPDLDGDGHNELAVTAGIHFSYEESSGQSTIGGGEVLIIPGGSIADGDQEAIDRGWRMAGGHGGGLSLIGNALAADTSGGPWLGPVVGTFDHEGFLGGAFLVDPAALGEPNLLENLDASADVDLLSDALAVTGTQCMSEEEREYTLGMDVAMFGDGWLAATGSGWPDASGSTVRAVTELYFVPELLWAFDYGETHTAEEIQPWVLVGAENTVAEWNDFWAFLGHWVDFVFDVGQVVDPALTYLEHCEADLLPDQGEAYAACLHPLIRAVALTHIYLGDFPRAFHVPAAHPDGILIGEPLYESSSGAAYVVATDVSAGPGTDFYLDPSSPYIPTGWTLSRLRCNEPSAWMGHSIASPGDIDADGHPDLVLGAPGSSEAAAGDDPIPGHAYLLLSGDFSDVDGDGLSVADGDCDDGDATNFPGNPEVCDGRDNDCDDLEDEDLLFETWFRDVDGDGTGDPRTAVHRCDGAPPGRWVPLGIDCDDRDPHRHPGAAEECDQKDNDCDGEIPLDEVDADGDGLSVCQGDCDDEISAVYPGAIETCDGIDEDCDGRIDEETSCSQGCGCTDAGKPSLALARVGVLFGLGGMLGRRRRQSEGKIRR